MNSTQVNWDEPIKSIKDTASDLGNKEDLGGVPEWIKDYCSEVLLGGESILPFICNEIN